MNNKNFYLIAPSMSGANKEARKELLSLFENAGFVNREGGMGAGPADIYHEVIAFLSVHTLFSSLLINIVASYILKLLDKLYLWYRKNYKQPSKYNPSVNIYIYSKNKKEDSIFISFYINKKYSKKEIIEKIKIAKKLKGDSGLK